MGAPVKLQAGKLQDVEQIKPLLEEARAAGKKVALCHGVFDLLHIGHIRYFLEARKSADVLVVSLTADNFVNKGPNRPAFNEQLRAESIAALESVDYVTINRAANAVQLIETLRPDFYIKGKDYKNRKRKGGGLEAERAAIEKAGGTMIFTEEDLYSSSALIKEYIAPPSPQILSFTRRIKESYSISDFEIIFEKIRKLNVMVIGEAIVDEYRYCQAIGKSGKEPVLVARYRSTEQFAGGTLAIANHIAAFCDNVSVLTFLGDKNRHEDFIRSQLKPNVTPIFLNYADRPTIVKRRYLDHYLVQKLFEVYVIEDDGLNESENEALLGAISKACAEQDCIVVADYGHGMMTESAIQLLASSAKFLAVNTQANAGNTGLHTISCYPRADYISLSFTELCLELRKREGDICRMIKTVLERVACNRITVTRGREGLITYDSDRGFFEAPGLTDNVVDRVGSGDAVLSISSLFSAVGAPAELMNLAGSIAGMLAVRTVGNRSSLDFGTVMRNIESLLK